MKKFKLEIYISLFLTGGFMTNWFLLMPTQTAETAIVALGATMVIALFSLIISYLVLTKWDDAKKIKDSVFKAQKEEWEEFLEDLKHLRKELFNF